MACSSADVAGNPSSACFRPSTRTSPMTTTITPNTPYQAFAAGLRYAFQIAELVRESPMESDPAIPAPTLGCPIFQKS